MSALFSASVTRLPDSSASRRSALAFELGWDYAHRGVTPPAEHLLEGSPVRQGWQAGCRSFGSRTLHADRHVRKWLQLRLHAWLRGRTFELTQVNPSFLRQIDVATCPITRETLTHGTGAVTDASVDRVCNDAGYAAGNLAVMSVRANKAKSVYGPLDAMRFARQIELGRLGEIDGLDAAGWARVAVLSSFATRLPHAVAAGLPLLVLPPNRLRVLSPVQALQVMLTLQLTRPGHSRRVAALAELVPQGDARRTFRTFMMSFLARRIAAGSHSCTTKGRQAIEDMWRDPSVHGRWRMLSACLGEGDCERIAKIAAVRGLAGPGLQWLSAESPSEGWALKTQGYVSESAARREGLVLPIARDARWRDPSHDGNATGGEVSAHWLRRHSLTAGRPGAKGHPLSAAFL